MTNRREPDLMRDLEDSLKPVRTDFIDFPTGWTLQAQIGHDSAEHFTDKCSAVQTNGAMLCDCGAIAVQWMRHGGEDWLRYVPEECKEAAITEASER